MIPGFKHIRPQLNLEWIFSGWEADSSIVTGLPNLEAWYTVSPEVFHWGADTYLISGRGGGNFYGAKWSGTQWVEDTGIINGLGSVGAQDSAPTVFELDGDWYLVSGGSSSNHFKGYKWNNTTETWDDSSFIEVGLSVSGFYSKPSAFYYNSTLYMVVAVDAGNFYMFKWDSTGNDWVADYDFDNGIDTLSNEWFPTTEVFTIGTDMYFLTGDNHSTWFGRKYNEITETWENDTTCYNGIGTSISRVAPTVFQLEDVWYTIIGNASGTFYGFKAK